MCIRNCTVREKEKNARSYFENSDGKRFFRKVVGSMFWVPGKAFAAGDCV